MNTDRETFSFDEIIERLSLDIDKFGGKNDYQKEVINTLTFLKNMYSTIYIVGVLDKPNAGNIKYINSGFNYSKMLQYVYDKFGKNWYDLGVVILEKKIEE